MAGWWHGWHFPEAAAFLFLIERRSNYWRKVLLILSFNAALRGAFETFRTFILFLDSIGCDYGIDLPGKLMARGSICFAFENKPNRS